MAYQNPALPKPATGNLGYTPAYSSNWFNNNQYQNPYGSFVNNNTAKANQLLNSQNPLAGISDINGWNAKFGFKKLNPNDPDIGSWMNNLRGGTNQAVQQNADAMANAGIASTRGGMGVVGGTDPRAMLGLQGTKQVAGQFGNDYRQAVDWTRQGINDWNSGASAYANAAADIYGKQLGSGTALMGQVLDALKSGDANQMAWAMQQMAAYQKDIDTYNRTAAENVQAQRAGELRQQQANQQLYNQNLLDQIFSPSNYVAGANSNPFLLPQIGRAQATGLLGIGKLGGSTILRSANPAQYDSEYNFTGYDSGPVGTPVQQRFQKI